MRTKHRTPRALSILPLLAFLLLLLPACAPSTPLPSTPTRNRTPIPWPTLDPNRPDVAFSPTELPEAVLGQPYEVTLTVTRNETPVGNIAVDDGELPPGLALTYEDRATSATIAGTPTEAGEFEFRLGAWCLGTSVSGQEGYQTYTLRVKQE